MCPPSRKRTNFISTLRLRLLVQEAVLDGIDERLPAGLDNILRHAYCSPSLLPLSPFNEHPGNGGGCLLGVENEHFVVLEVDVIKLWISPADGQPQCGVEGVYGAVAFTGRDYAFAPHMHLYRGLGDYAAVLPLLHDHPETLEPEETLLQPEGAPHEEFEGPVRRFEMVAPIFHLLDHIKDFLHLVGILGEGGSQLIALDHDSA